MENDYTSVHKVINTVTKKRGGGGGGITLLRVQHKDTHKTLLEPLEMSRALRDHAIKHYGQAKATPFGKRDVFDKLTEEPMTNPFYDEILNGMLDHQHELSDSHKLFGKHLRSKVSPDLAPEAEKLAEPMTLILHDALPICATADRRRMAPLPRECMLVLVVKLMLIREFSKSPCKCPLESKVKITLKKFNGTQLPQHGPLPFSRM